MFEVLKSVLGSSASRPAAAGKSAGSFLKDLGEGIANAAGSLAGGLFSSVGGAPQADFSQLSVPQRPAEKPSLSAQLRRMVGRAQQFSLIGQMGELAGKFADRAKEKAADA